MQEEDRTVNLIKCTETPDEVKGRLDWQSECVFLRMCVCACEALCAVNPGVIPSLGMLCVCFHDESFISIQSNGSHTHARLCVSFPSTHTWNVLSIVPPDSRSVFPLTFSLQTQYFSPFSTRSVHASLPHTHTHSYSHTFLFTHILVLFSSGGEVRKGQHSQEEALLLMKVDRQQMNWPVIGSVLQLQMSSNWWGAYSSFWCLSVRCKAHNTPPGDVLCFTDLFFLSNCILYHAVKEALNVNVTLSWHTEHLDQ